MNKVIKLAYPDIRQEDIELAITVLKSGDLVQGRYVSEFESELIRFTNLPFCAVTTSGTAALHLALLALGIGPGDLVIVPGFTFPATANVVEAVGANLLFCDVDPFSYVITPQALEQVITNNRDKNIKAIMVVHEFGYPAQIKEISEIAEKYSLTLIEDAACGLGTIADGQHVGHFSHVACLSFHPRKAITSGEGGALISMRYNLIEKSKILRNHGILYQNSKVDFIMPGLNYRMTDFQAAIALGQLQRFLDELKARRRLVDIYVENLCNLKNLRVPELREGHSWQSFMVVLDRMISRDRTIEKLLSKGIQTSIGAQALNCLTYYADKYRLNENDMPNATELYRQGLVLPMYGKLEDEQANHISKVLKNVVG
ncbi:MAG: DegT/DnrJ/EryC1/StrS aminotransferase family protein [Desulfobacterales bacterium]|nr:DegT/DnrJ/EryC1/StrS aminotransferase family protein [Desulfobacterales bacterium]